MTQAPAAALIRSATARDVAGLARLWHDAWHDAHAAHVPPALLARRDRAYFANAMAAEWFQVRLAQSGSTICGFHLCRPPVLDLLFVARAWRGRGIGTALLADAETVLACRGTAVAQLDCLSANTDACRFYAAQGWCPSGTRNDPVPTSDGAVDVISTRFEKPLGTPPPQVSPAPTPGR